jgi:hypothetical protein
VPYLLVVTVKVTRRQEDCVVIVAPIIILNLHMLFLVASFVLEKLLLPVMHMTMVATVRKAVTLLY